MSVDLDRQLREYCRQMDEAQGALSLEDILERTGELQVIPGRGTKQPTPRRWWVAAAAAALAILILVIGTRFLPAADRTPEPADQPTTTSLSQVWPGPVHGRDPLVVHRMDGETDDLVQPLARFAWPDALDTPVGWIDVKRVVFDYQDCDDGAPIRGLEDLACQPQWSIELAARPPLLGDLEPGLLIAHGLVLDTTGDGVADYVIGIDNSAPKHGDFHVWVTDLTSGETDEQIGPPYGFPIEFFHPSEQPSDPTDPFTDPPSILFTFLGDSVPQDLNPWTVRFYAWASATRGGEVYAWDYAPDAGWITGNTTPEATTDTLPAFGLPGTRLDNPARIYGWTGALGSSGWMHKVIDEDPSTPEGVRERQLLFAVENDCFTGSQGAEPTAVTVAGLGGLHLEPYDDDSLGFAHSGETTAAYALPIGDRTLCVYLRWNAATTQDELSAAREVVESIRGEPYGEDGIRINFKLPFGWDTG